MIAVSVHEMIPVTSELLAKLLQDLLHLVLSEVSVTEVETLLVFELLSQLSGLARTGNIKSQKTSSQDWRGHHLMSNMPEKGKGCPP